MLLTLHSVNSVVNLRRSKIETWYAIQHPHPDLSHDAIDCLLSQSPYPSKRLMDNNITFIGFGSQEGWITTDIKTYTTNSKNSVHTSTVRWVAKFEITNRVQCCITSSSITFSVILCIYLMSKTPFLLMLESWKTLENWSKFRAGSTLISNRFVHSPCFVHLQIHENRCTTFSVIYTVSHKKHTKIVLVISSTKIN